ncbi:GspH/FimT family protein [Pseudoxanthomonas winnipegensis]
MAQKMDIGRGLAGISVRPRSPSRGGARLVRRGGMPVDACERFGRGARAWRAGGWRGGSAGFTLLELMVVVVVLAILAAIAFPSFKSVIQQTQLTTQANSLVAGLALARSEAIRTIQASGLCPSTDGSSCAASWSGGWLVWDDTNGDGVLSAGEPVVRYEAGNDRLQLSGTGGAVVNFDSRGRRASGVDQVLSLQPVDCASGAAGLRRDITVAATGSVKVVSGACS